MSTTVDNRVVAMEFDNKHFEQNVATSMSTLDKLKKSLKLDGVAKGLNGISSAAKKVDISPVGKAAETVGLKFNALYTVADQALRNITNSAMNAGKRIISALTIDPVKTGFNEYETKIGSIQTIMSNTASKGTTMADVTRVIDELNTYADKTIYNFAEMTRNIGTFTAAGVGLEESAAAIQGIANLAAASGSTSQQASTAMYQLSQALAAGTVKLMDWNSVVNAGMGGEKFQEALKATARDHGIAVDELIEKNGSFRESLQEGWISADILNETLNKFTVDGAKNYAKSMVDSGKWTQQQADALVKEAQAMEDAATKVKTFTQLWDTMKESAQSGWGKTWELIVGDFEEAKTLWTGVSNVLNGMIEKSGNARNDMLEGALSSNWEKLTKKINEAGIETADFEEKVKNIAKNHGKDVDALVEEYGSLEKVFQSGALSSDILNEALGKMGESMVDLSGVTRELKNGLKGDDVKQIEKALTSLGYTLTGKDGKNYGEDGYFGTLTRDAIKAFQEAEGLEVTGIVDDKTLKALEEATKKTKTWSKEVHNLIDGITELGGREKLIEGFKNLFTGFSKLLKPVGKAFRDVFPRTTSEQVYGLISGFHALTEKFNEFLDSASGQTIIKGIGAAFKGLFSVIGLGLDGLKSVGSFLFGVLVKGFGALGGVVLDLAGSFGTGLTAIKDWVDATGIIPAMMELIGNAIQNGVKFLKDFASSAKKYIGTFIEEAGGLKGILTTVFGEPFTVAIDKLGEFFGRLKDIKKFDADTLSAAFDDFKTNVVEYFKKIDIGQLFENFVGGIKNFAGAVKDHFTKIGGKFGDIISKIGEFGKAVKEFFGKNLGGLIAVGGLITFFAVIKKIKDMLEILVKPLDVLDDLAGGLKSLGKAVKFSIKTTALKNIAISLAILAGSLAVLALLPAEKLKAAVIAIGVVSGILAGVIFVLSKVSDKMGDLAKLSGSVLMLAGSIFVFAMACKTIAGIDDGGIGKCLIVIGGFVGIIALLMKATKMMGPGDLAAFGTMMMGLGGALLLFSVAIGILGNMELGTLMQGGIAVAAFLGLMAGMMKATKSLSKDMPRFATTMAGLAGALLLFTVSVGILGNMDTETLLKGGAAIAVFLGMMAGMMKATSVLGKDMPKFGATMLGMSVGILALAMTAKILAGIDGEDLIKGGIVIAAFLGMMVGMMKATQMLTKHSANAAKVGLMMLSFAGSMVLLTGVIAILSAIKPADLAKATIAIGAIALIFGGLVAITKFAKVGKGVAKTITSMSIAVGIIAVSLAALSLVDSNKLEGATKALGVVISTFALLTASTKFVGTKTIGTLMTLVGAITILGGLLYLLADLPGDNVLGVAKGLSSLILSLSASCLLLAAVGKIGPAAFIGIGVLAALMGVVGLFVGIAIASLPAVGKQLSEFMENLKPFLEGAKEITPEIGEGLKTLGEALAILTGVGFANAVSFGLPFKQFSKDMVHLAKGLTEFNDAVSGDNFDATKIKAAASAAAELAGVSATVSDSTGLLDWISILAGKGSAFANFGKDLIPVANGLVDFNAAVSGEDFDVEKIKAAASAASELAAISATTSESKGLLEWVSTLAGKGSAFANFGKDLIPVAKGLVEFNSSVSGDDFDVKKVKAAATAASELAAISVTVTEGKGLLDWISTLAGKGSAFANFGKDLIPVANGLVEFNTAVTGENFDVKKVKAAASAAAELAGASAAVTESTGLLDWIAQLNGKASIFANFGKDLIPVANGLVEFNAAVTGEDFNAGKIKSAASAASELAGVSVTVADGTGLLDWISTLAGKGSAFGNFGKDLIPVANGLVEFNNSVTGDNFDATKIKAAAEAASALASVSVTISEGTSFFDWVTSLFGGDTNTSTFASSLKGLGDGLVAFNTSIGGATFNGEQMKAAVNALSSLTGVAGDVGENSAGWDWLTGKDSLGDFGTNLETLGSALASFSTSVSGKDFDISSVTSAVTEISNLASVGTTIGGKGMGNLASFGYDVQSLGNSLNIFYTDISGIDSGKLSSVATAIKDLASVDVSTADTLQSFLNSLGNVGTDGVDSFVQSISNGTPKVLMAATKLMTSFINGIRTRSKHVATVFKAVLTTATASINNHHTSFSSAGGYLVEGFAAGISANSYKAAAAAAAMAKAAKQAAEAALGISSPAKEMIEDGEFTTDGFVVGVLNGVSRVYNAGLEIADYAKRGFTKALSGLSDMVANGIDAEPTIRPVLDLSEVSAGANKINGMLDMNPSVGAMSNVTAISAMMSRRQNGPNSDVISAIKDLGKTIGGMPTTTTNNYIDGVYSNDNAVNEAIGILIRAATIEGRT